MQAQKSRLIQDEMSDRIIATAEQIAMEQGAESLNVRKILQALGITNRVFYNRFHNIDEVLNIVYENTVVKIRKSLAEGFDPNGDFFEQIKDIVAKTLLSSYENKNKINGYIFETDSVSEKNFKWWQSEIKKIIEYGKAKGYFRNIDSDIMSYSVWCFIRGYNADALGRNLPKEEAVANFRYSFGVLLEGMRA